MVIERYKEWYVNNTTNTDQIVTLSLYDPCNSNADPTPVDGFQQTVTANTESKILFTEDGSYSVIVDGDTGNGTIARYYLNLFESFITYTSAALCTDSNCLSVTSPDTTSYVANALAKALYYASVNDTKYIAAIESMLPDLKCSAATEWSRISNQESYLGQSNVNYLSQIELAYYYNGFRNTDILTEDTAGIDEIYDYDKISYCIQKLGIVDCGDQNPLPGTQHTAVISATPLTLGLGVDTSITISYTFTSNDDTFTELVDTNIPNVSLNKFDGFTQTEIIPNQTIGEQYYITYKYSRGGQISQNTVSVTTQAYAPQWYGGESITATFDLGGGTANAATVESALSIAPVYKANASGTSSNSNTSDKYIWWVTNAPVKFYIGAFEIQTGPWDDACDPNSYAIITKSLLTTMEDGVTTQILYYYRTCPLQNLAGQTLSYTLTE